MSDDLELWTAAGNRFALYDAVRRGARAGSRRDDAVAVCAAEGVDGLLVVAPGTRGGDVRMTVWNADGSRPEACGNGLRCVAAYARAAGHARGTTVRVETDAGLRRVELVPGGARAEMGRPRVAGAPVALDVEGEAVVGRAVDVGNPHFAVAVGDVDRVELERLGPALECHPRFPGRTNVEVYAPAGDGLAVRIWERGVGETASCGTGVTAAAAVAIAAGVLASPALVETRGGRLCVEWDGRGAAFLTGPVEPPVALTKEN